MTPLQVAQGMFGTPEFTALHSGQSDSAFVNSLYENGLGRAPDTAGSNFWTGLLSTGAATRPEVLLGIAQSAEAIHHNSYIPS